MIWSKLLGSRFQPTVRSEVLINNLFFIKYWKVIRNWEFQGLGHTLWTSHLNETRENSESSSSAFETAGTEPPVVLNFGNPITDGENTKEAFSHLLRCWGWTPANITRKSILVMFWWICKKKKNPKKPKKRALCRGPWGTTCDFCIGGKLSRYTTRWIILRRARESGPSRRTRPLKTIAKPHSDGPVLTLTSPLLH